VILGLLLLPAIASAATVSERSCGAGPDPVFTARCHPGQTAAQQYFINFQAAPGEKNTVLVFPALRAANGVLGPVQITDQTAALHAGSDCVQSSYDAHTVFCPYLPRIVAHLGDGNDSLAPGAGSTGGFYGSAQPAETVYTGTGVNTVWGSEKADLQVGQGTDDTLIGWGGNDRLIIGSGQAYGADGNDQLIVAKRASSNGCQGETTSLFGGPGNDTFSSQTSSGCSSWFGGLGNDLFLIRPPYGNTSVQCGPGVDVEQQLIKQPIPGISGYRAGARDYC